MTKLFHRDGLAALSDWGRASPRKPLVVRGARQVGKTSLVRLFARNYRRFAELNLERKTHADLFRRGLNPDEVIQAILLECAVPPGTEPLLLFLDEIQEVPEAVALLRFFYEERPDIHVIAAGSLLELALESAAISFPVGRVQYLYVRPLSFCEFLSAMAETAAREAVETVPVLPHAHDKLLRLFHQYALVGGMPEAVVQYRTSGGDITAVNQVYADLFAGFRDDILKYGRNETMRKILLHSLDAAPYEAGSRITFQGFGVSSYRSREAGEALRTLARAMLMELVYPTVQVREPLTPDYKKSPRLHFVDVGLVNHRAGLQRALIGVQDLTDVHRGRLIEQVVGQELKTIQVRSDIPLAFWVRDKAQSQAEVDFLLTSDQGVVPVEAKSGTEGKLRSLHQFISRSKAGLAVRLYAGRPGRQKITTTDRDYTLLDVPYYASAQIMRYIALEKDL
ncbi:MAG TPA: AAA family ATPase [Kiritimatiellia bacterium]|nr:AAA family ATPase [Kiritimatiellia bacterium]